MAITKSDYELACKKLFEIRSKLNDILKLNSMRVEDIFRYYKETQLIVRALLLKRFINPNLNTQQSQTETEKKEDKKQNESNPEEVRELFNKYIKTIDDTLLLLSESFIFVGMNDHIAAQYSSLLTIKRMLDQIKRTPRTYNIETISPIKSKLTEIKNILDNYDIEKAVENEDDLYMMLNHRFQDCTETLNLVENDYHNIAIPNIDKAFLPLIYSLLNIKLKINTLSSISVNIPSQRMIRLSSQIPDDHKEKAMVLSLENKLITLKTSLLKLKTKVIKTRSLDSTEPALRGDAIMNSLMNYSWLVIFQSPGTLKVWVTKSHTNPHLTMS